MKPGFFMDMTADQYFSDPCPAPSFTQSLAKVLLDQSALHAKFEHPKLRPAVSADDEETEKYDKAKAIGNAAHALLIGRGKMLAVGEFDNWQTKDAKAYKADALKDGKMPILSKHMKFAHALVLRAHEQLVTAGWGDAFHRGDGEVVACWQEGDLWFRTMIDWMSPDRLVLTDLKTSGMSFAPHTIGRLAVAAGWDLQAAMHERAMNALDPDNAGRRKFRFAAIENYLPYALVPVEMSETWLTLGRKKLEMAIAIWRHAMQTGKFDGYPTQAITPEYPGYLETQWLEREVAHSERPINIFAAG